MTVFAVLSLLPSRDPWQGIDAASFAQLEEHRLKGAALLEGGSPGGAATEFQAIIRKRPRLALGHVDLAAAWLVDQRHNPEALRAAQKGVSLLPSAAWPKVVLARALEANNRPAEALQRLQAAVQVEPENPRVLGALIEFLDRPGQSAVAGGSVDSLRHRTVERLAQLAPDNLAAQLEYLPSQVRRAEVVGARRTLKRVRELYSLEALRYGGRALAQLDRSLTSGKGDAVMGAYILRNVVQNSDRYRRDRQALFGMSYGSHRLLMPGWGTPPPRFPPPSPTPVAITWNDVTEQVGLASMKSTGIAPIAAGDLALANFGIHRFAAEANQAQPQLLLGGVPPLVLDPADRVRRSGVGSGSPLVFDADGDQLLDLYVAAPSGDRVWGNTRKINYTPQNTTISGPTGDSLLTAAGRTRGRGAGTALAADFDGDGIPDVIRASEAPDQPPLRYLHNERKLVFRDQTRQAGLPRRSGAARQAVFADFDANGTVDLFVVRPGAGPGLFLNTWVSSRGSQGGSDASFRDATRTWGIHPAAGAQSAVVGDFDHDGDFDVAVVGESPHGAVWYRNSGSRFAADAAALASAGQSTWIDALDYDNDTWLDLAVAGPDGIRLLRNEEGKFGTAQRISTFPARWVRAVDWDLDGDMDLLSTDAAGAVRLLDNVGANARPWMKVEVQGIHDPYGLGTAIRPQTLWGEQLLLVTGPITHVGLGAAPQAIALRAGYGGENGPVTVSPSARSTCHHVLFVGW